MRKLYITKWHIAIEIVAYVLIAASFIVAIVGQYTLPDRMPTHYDLAGNVDGYGSPSFLFVMPVTMLICNLLISMIAHFMNPALWNMPFKIKPDRKVAVYRDIVSLYVWIELEIALFNLGFVVMCYTQRMEGIMLLAMVFMAAPMITVICCVILAARHNK
ncbi:MAG: DUF1648 domain-containing protein [Butyrivibrio sp.]|nr:DUF1648 domain-containing protein [Muribaculum sp.]MCM1553787.1 DUF1648 domain-containing protein [Butyrivibrio sp.]